MIFGDPGVFAIDTDICRDWRGVGIGWFNLVIKCQRYGTREPDATALGGLIRCD
jgi:hypothetical protein